VRTDEDDAWLGRTLSGRYALRRRFEGGGMSRAYDAWDEHMGRRVAVKLVEHGSDNDERSALSSRSLGASRRAASQRGQPARLALRGRMRIFRHGVCRRQSLEELVDKKRFQAEESITIIARLLEALEASRRGAAASGRETRPPDPEPETLKLIDFGLVSRFRPLAEHALAAAHAPGALHGHAFVHAARADPPP